MSTIKTEVQAVVCSNLDKTSKFSLEIKTLNSAERLERAMKRGGLLFVGAVLCLPIPLAHLILVPSFLLFSIYSFFSILGKHSVVMQGDLLCPNCNEKIPPPKSSFNWPVQTTCSKCQMQIRMNPISST